MFVLKFQGVAGVRTCVRSRDYKSLPKFLGCIDNNNDNNNNNNNDCLLRLIAAIYRMAELQSYLQNI